MLLIPLPREHQTLIIGKVDTGNRQNLYYLQRKEYAHTLLEKTTVILHFAFSL